MDDKKLKDALFLIAFGVVLYVGMTHLSTVLAAVSSVVDLLLPVLIGAIFAFVLNVPMSGLERMFQQAGKSLGRELPVIPVRVASLLITLAGIVLAFVGAVALVIPELIESARSIIPLAQEKIPEWIAFAEANGIDLSGLVQQMSELSQKVSADGASSLVGSAAVIARSTILTAGNTMLGMVIAIYLLLGKHNFSRQALMIARANLPAGVVQKIRFVGNLACETYAKFLSGQFVEAIILGCLMYTTFKIFGLPYAGITAYLTSLCAFVPYVGAFLSGASGVVLTLLADPVKAPICLVVYLATQFIENQFIYPRVVGGSVGLAPMWALLAAIVGGKLFGVVGIVFFIPLASVIYTLVRDDTLAKLARKQGQDALDRGAAIEE
ncbi:AI-2E family transporter [Collinsella tanakaei]|uniref:AI-2E family transporter n=1 Tax=Collinsella tanakaei TaxID=626935 RepID=A0A3E4QQE9_9ACTN|nr:AI-2E family transporter [Collinsella tanakaei]RGL08424.1 AI-2E family transporter [Collinsella tanakaei]